MAKTLDFSRVFAWCGKQDLKSETVVNPMVFSIIWDNSELQSNNFS